ncbi:Actin-binding protein anillin [Strongyloides ratti]|uniref:Actin-binding protein anillin n=1 Tax=Strongyloides ratti TaxID=34506 RepID=A0A090LG98_STRRB|nr:Actin-binding protein anillin [Strongyloides ratti]CEF66545.1 Actin-binding protein anillin [Strongyloides ratti]
MENSPVPLAQKLLEKARQRQKEIDECDSPVAMHSSKSYPAPVKVKGTRAPSPPKDEGRNVLTSLNSPKKNRFAEIAEAYNNFEYKPSNALKTKEDYLVRSPRKNFESSTFVSPKNVQIVKNQKVLRFSDKEENIPDGPLHESTAIEDDEKKTNDLINSIEQSCNDNPPPVPTSSPPHEINEEIKNISPISDNRKNSTGSRCHETTVITKRVITTTSTTEIKYMDDDSEDKKITSEQCTTVNSAPSITRTKALDIARRFDSAIAKTPTTCKQAAVKYIDGNVAVKSLRPGALSPTLLYGNRGKVDMKNSEVVVPETKSVKNLKSKWEANISLENKTESVAKDTPKSNIKRIFEAPFDQPVGEGESPWKDKVDIEGPPLKSTKTNTSLTANELISDDFTKQGDSDNDVYKTPNRDFKFDYGEGSADRLINDAFDFVQFENSAIPSPFSDYRTPHGNEEHRSLMDDINTELNRFCTPRTHLRNEKIDKNGACDPADSPQRQLVHSISFYRKKAKEIEEVVKNNIDSSNLETMSSSGCNGSNISCGSNANEGVCEEYIDIEATKKELKEGIRVQQYQIAQASRAISYCRQNNTFKGSREEVDAQRALLIANEKRKALSLEYEKINKNGIPSTFSKEPRGTLSIMNIAIRLSREFINMYINQKADSYLYYFIALIKFADKVLHTQLVSSDTGVQSGYIEFPAYINLKNLPSNFVVTLDIFSLRTMRESKHTKDIKNKSKTLTPFKKLTHSTPSSNNLPNFTSPGGVAGVVDPSFQKAGTLNFSLSQVSRKNFMLNDVVQPLEGTVSLNMKCFAEKGSGIEYKGFLNLYQCIGDLSSWNRYWCVLKGTNLTFWKYPEEEDKKSPAIIIDLESVKGEVKHTNDESACFPNTMEMFVDVLDQSKLSTLRIMFAADTSPQMTSWLTNINECLKFISLWNCKKSPVLDR